MDRFQYDLIDASLEHPSLSVVVWGRGWKGWDSSQSAQVNLQRRFGDACAFDMVFAHRFHEGLDLRRPKCHTVYTYELGDCHGFQCHDQYSLGAQVVSFRYSNVPIELFLHERLVPAGAAGSARSQLLVHNPDCANSAVFHPLEEDGSQEEQNGIVLFGKADLPYLYPTRHRLLHLIRTGALADLNASVYAHPGYNIAAPGLDDGDAGDAAPSPPVTGYDPMSPLTAKHRATRDAYASAMRRARICVFGSSVVKKAIRKFPEAFFSGCVVASDVPHDMHDDIRRVIIPLGEEQGVSEDSDGDEDDEEDGSNADGGETRKVLGRDALIARKLHFWYHNSQGLQRKRAAARALAFERFTCRSKLDRLWDASNHYRRGARGLVMPFGTRIDCHSYHGASYHRWAPPPPPPRQLLLLSTTADSSGDRRGYRRRFYTVEPGDTLIGIANRAISGAQQTNSVSNDTDDTGPGDRGFRASSIASAVLASSSWEDIARWNQISDPTALQVGQALVIDPPEEELRERAFAEPPKDGWHTAPDWCQAQALRSGEVVRLRAGRGGLSRGDVSGQRLVDLGERRETPEGWLLQTWWSHGSGVLRSSKRLVCLMLDRRERVMGGRWSAAPVAGGIHRLSDYLLNPASPEDW